MIYFDTAYLAKCYLREPGCEAVRLLATSAGRIACCEMGRVELNAVFHRHLREGKLTSEQFHIVFAQFAADEVDVLWKWLPVTSRLLAKTGNAFRQLPSGVFVRAADALHLTCTRENGFDMVYTNDQHMLAAAETFGIEGRNIL